MSDSELQTEFDFTLPQGYVDDDGTVHKHGRMRLATAADEIRPLTDPRVQENGSYMTILLLSRVVTQLGSVSDTSVDVIESLFVNDLAYLQQLYERINDGGSDFADVMGGTGDRGGMETDDQREIQTGDQGGMETDDQGGMEPDEEMTLGNGPEE
jgi:hypothetical protein